MNQKIEVRIEDLLKARGRSVYWLAKETGISYTTLWRLKTDKALGINFATLEAICGALGCEPGDIMKFRTREKELKTATPERAKSAARGLTLV